MTLVTTSDNFNRADESLNKSGGNWVGNTTYPVIVSNQLTAAAATNGTVGHVAEHEGLQSAEVTLKLKGAGTTKFAVLCAMPPTGTAPGSFFNWYTTEPHYRLRVLAASIALQKKADGSAGYTTLATSTTTPSVNDVFKITYDPATGVLKGYVDGGSGFVEEMSYTDPDPIPDTQQRVGLYVNDGSIVDSFAASWEVDDGGGGSGSGGWAAYEYDSSGPTETLLAWSEWNGSTEDTIDLAATAIQADDPSTLPLVQPRWSDEARDGLGVNCHYKFSGSSSNVHSQVAQLTAYLTELGCGWIRDRMTNPGSVHNTQMQQFGILQAAHIGVHLTLSQGTNSGLSNPSWGWNDTTQADYDYYWGELAGTSGWRITVGGPNEPDDVPQLSGWSTKLRDQMKKLFDTRAVFGMQAVPIVSPSLKDGQSEIQTSFTTMGALNAWQFVDINDLHRYPLGKNSNDPEWTSAQPNALGRTPAFLLDDRIAGTKVAFKAPVTFSTEGGYNTDLNVTVGGEHIPDDIHGYYAERHLMEMLYRGVKRFFYYELMDDPDPGDNRSEAHRGLIFTPTLSVSTWSRKPAFTRLKALMALVKDWNATYDVDTNPFVPPKVRMQVACSDSQFRSLFMAKRNGTKILFYWLDKALWDVGANKRIGTTSGEITQQQLGWLPTGNLTGGQPVTEASGMVHSRIHANTVWIHDDSNPQHYVWAFDYTGGISFKKTIELVGDGFTITEDGQWEDAAYSAPDSSIWIANCGGNLNEFTAYKFVEPTDISGSGSVLQVDCDRYKFQYAGGQSFNCESMMCDPSGRVYFVPKHNGVGDGQSSSDVGLWRAPASLAAWPTANTLTKVATVAPASSGVYGAADWAPDNSFFMPIKTSNQVPETTPTVDTIRFATSSPFAEIDRVPVAVARKANRSLGITMEIACFKPDSSGIIVGGEGSGSELWLTDFGTGTSGGVPATLETDTGTVVLTATPVVQSHTWT